MPPIIGILAGLAAIGIGGAVGFATTLGTLLLGIGLSTVLGGISSLLVKKPDLASLRDKLNGRTITARNVIAPRRILAGEVRTGGVITSLHTSNVGINIQNGYLNIVVTLSGHEVDSIGNLYFDGELVPLTPSGSGFVATGKYAGHVYVEKRLGTPDQTAFVGYQTQRPGGWTANHRQRGCALAYLRLLFNPDLFNGMPNITFDVKGLKAPDPRLAKTISSISRTANVVTVTTSAAHGLAVGQQVEQLGVVDASFNGRFRIATAPNSTTYTYAQTAADASSSGGEALGFFWTENPALLCRELQVWEMYGFGTDPKRVDDDRVITAANVCDEGVPLLAGGTQKRYTANGSWESSETLGQVMLQLLGSMAGVRARTTGLFQFFAGAALTPETVYDEDDLWGPLKVETRMPRRDLFNAVKGLFVSPANDWQASDFPPITSATYQTEDGGLRVWRDLELPFTTSHTMAMRLAKIELERARRQLRVRGDFHLRSLAVQPPETLLLQVSRFGWTNREFQVGEQQLVVRPDDEGAPLLLCELMLRQHDDAIYAWSSSEESGMTTPGTPTVFDPADVRPVALAPRNLDFEDWSFGSGGQGGLADWWFKQRTQGSLSGFSQVAVGAFGTGLFSQQLTAELPVSPAVGEAVMRSIDFIVRPGEHYAFRGQYAVPSNVPGYVGLIVSKGDFSQQREVIIFRPPTAAETFDFEIILTIPSQGEAVMLTNHGEKALGGVSGGVITPLAFTPAFAALMFGLGPASGLGGGQAGNAQVDSLDWKQLAGLPPAPPGDDDGGGGSGGGGGGGTGGGTPPGDDLPSPPGNDGGGGGHGGLLP